MAVLSAFTRKVIFIIGNSMKRGLYWPDMLSAIGRGGSQGKKGKKEARGWRWRPEKDWPLYE